MHGKETKSIIIDRLCRVEGHGGITVEIKDGEVKRVQVDMFEGPRFFEELVVGRMYHELPQIVSRICAICCAAHTLAAILAVEDAFGISLSKQTRLLRELLLLGGNIESHALHLFLLALPDYLGLHGAADMLKKYPKEVEMGLGLKMLGNRMQEVIGGRAVHPVNAVIGGFGGLPTEKELSNLRRELSKGLKNAKRAIDFISTLEIPTLQETDTLCAALKPRNGKYSLLGDKISLSAGKKQKICDYKKIFREKVLSYTHAKHSLYQGKPFFVGALARLIINEKSLEGEARKAKNKLGLKLASSNILHNNTAQAVELVYSIERSIQIIDCLLKNGLKSQRIRKIRPKEESGFGAVEAPRGTLYHSYRFNKKGRVTASDIITPTAQNLAMMEKDIKIAAQKLINDRRELLTSRLEMIVRAYDPCISCSVHLVYLTEQQGWRFRSK